MLQLINYTTHFTLPAAAARQAPPVVAPRGMAANGGILDEDDLRIVVLELLLLVTVVSTRAPPCLGRPCFKGYLFPCTQELPSLSRRHASFESVVCDSLLGLAFSS